MEPEFLAGAIDVDSGGGVVDLTGDEDPTDEDGDIRMGDSTGVSMSLGGEISSGGNKSRESNIGDSREHWELEKIQHWWRDKSA
ncbi:hypothetical protein Tco_0368901 [Tanacetum coccineum]